MRLSATIIVLKDAILDDGKESEMPGEFVPTMEKSKRNLIWWLLFFMIVALPLFVEQTARAEGGTVPDTTIKLHKNLLPAGDPGAFELLFDTTIVVTNTQINPDGIQLFHNLTSGTYSIKEKAKAGTVLSDYEKSITCTKGVDPLAATLKSDGHWEIKVAPGDTIDCTITNTRIPAQLALTKSDGGNVARPGSDLNYILTATSNSNGGASNVLLTETVPLHTTFSGPASWNCTIGAPAGTKCTRLIPYVEAHKDTFVTFTVKVNPRLDAGVTQLSNTASIGDSNTPTAATASDTTPVIAAPKLLIGKSDGGVVVEPGKVLVYTLVYTNTGNQDATNVVINETVPPNTTFLAMPDVAWSCADGSVAGTPCKFTVGNLAGGNGKGSLQFRVRVQNPLPENTTEIVNTATIGDDRTASAATATEKTPADIDTDISIVKDDGGASAKPGGDVVYTISYANNGNQVINNLEIIETVPDNTTFVGDTTQWNCTFGAPAATVCKHTVGSLGEGQTGSLPFTVKVNEILPVDVTQITNQVLIGQSGAPTLDDSIDVTTINRAPDLSLTADDGGLTVAPNGTVVYMLNYTNLGSRPATGIVIEDAIPTNTGFDTANSSPGWTCTIGICTYRVGNLASGASGTAKFAVKVNPEVSRDVVQVTNQATIHDDGSLGVDANLADNTSGDTTPIVHFNSDSALRVTLVDYLLIDFDADSQVSPGDTLLYRLTVENLSPEPVTNILIENRPDANSALVAGSVRTDRGQVITGNTAGDTAVKVDLSSPLPGGSGVTISLQVKVNADATGSRLVSQATVTFLNGVTGSAGNLSSDDPDTATDSDATLTPLSNTAPIAGRIIYLPLVSKR